MPTRYAKQPTEPKNKFEGMTWLNTATGEKWRWRGKRGWVRYRLMKAPVWSTRELRVLREAFPSGGVEGVQKLIDRPVHSIQVKAHKLGIKGPRCGQRTKLIGEDLAQALAWADEGVAIEEIARRLQMGAPTVSNGVCIAIAQRAGTAAERNDKGGLTDQGLEQIRAAIMEGWRGVEIQRTLGVSASRVSRERKILKRERKKPPPPGNGLAYCGVRVPPIKKREVEALYMTGLGTLKVSIKTGVSKTACLRVRAKLIAKLKRRGECLPGCDNKGVRRKIKDSAKQVAPEQRARLRKLLMERVPVSAAARMVGMGGCSAYDERDRLRLELMAAGRQLPPPLRQGKKAFPVPKIDLNEAKQHAIAEQRAVDEARQKLVYGMIAAFARSFAPPEAQAIKRKRKLSFEEQIALIEAGQARITQVVAIPRGGFDHTMGGVVGEINL